MKFEFEVPVHYSLWAEYTQLWLLNFLHTVTHVSFLTITPTGFTSVADTLALALISSYFTIYYHAATNIVTTGLPSAITIFAPVTQLSIDTYGWRGTMILLGGINFHCIAAGVILKPVKQTQVPYENLKNGLLVRNVNAGDSDNIKGFL